MDRVTAPVLGTITKNGVGLLVVDCLDCRSPRLADYACPKCQVLDLKRERDTLRAELAAATARAEGAERERDEARALSTSNLEAQRITRRRAEVAEAERDKARDDYDDEHRHLTRNIEILEDVMRQRDKAGRARALAGARATALEGALRRATKNFDRLIDPEGEMRERKVQVLDASAAEPAERAEVERG